MGTPAFFSDFTLINDCDATTGWADPLVGKVIQETDIKIQGVASIGTEAKVIGRYELQYDYVAGGIDLTGQHIMMWIFFVGPGFCAPKDSAGITVRVQDTAGNIGDWYVGGNDVAWVGKGWKFVVADVDRAFDENNGTDPSRTSIRYISATAQVTTAVGKGTAFAVDIMRHGTRFEIVGGDEADPISFQDIIEKDINDDSYFGIVQRDKNGNVEINGQIYLGDPSGTRGLTTVFKDVNEVVVFADNPVASGYYQLNASQAAGSLTNVVLGEPVGSGNATIGSKGITLIADETEFARNAFTTTSGWPHKPLLNFRDSVSGLGLYSLQTRGVDKVFLGSSSGAIIGSNIEVVDCNFNDIDIFEKNIDSDSGFPLLLRNKVSFARDPQAGFNLLDEDEITRDQIDIVQSAGFINTPSGISLFKNVDYDFTQFLEPFINVDDNETWNVVNPTWTIETSGQDQLNFVGTTNNRVNEKYKINLTVSQPNGTAISGSNTWVGHTSPSIELPLEQRLTTNVNGIATSRYLTNIYTAFASGLDEQPMTDTFLKAYFYGRSPFVTSLGTVGTEQNIGITLVSDGNIGNPNQGSGITNGSGIIVTRDQVNPFAIIEYTGGNGGTINAGDVIAGVSSSASGIYIETVSGDTTDGKILLENIFGNFSAGEEIDIISGGGTWDDANFVASSQQEFTWGIDADGKSLQTTYDYLSAKTAEPSGSIDNTFLEAIEWGEDENGLLVQAVGGDTYKTERTVRISEGVIIYNYGAGSIQFFTADDGTTFTPPTTVTLTLSNLQSSSEVRIYNNVAGEAQLPERDGIENSSTSFAHTYVHEGSDIPVIIVVFHINYLPVRLFISLTNSDQTIPIQQITDRVYSNP
jgi:hypothetical protein